MAWLVTDDANCIAHVSRVRAAEAAEEMVRWNGGVVPRLVPLVERAALDAWRTDAANANAEIVRLRAERDEARAVARELAVAHERDARPTGRAVRAALKYPDTKRRSRGLSQFAR